MTRRLDELSGPAVARRITPSSSLVWPIGAVEQHGPHLPMSVDHVIADELATAVIGAVGDELDVWQLPTTSVSASGEHAWSIGTLWLSARTMLALVDDVGDCVAATGARRLVFLNAHGGNTALLQLACRELRRRHGLLTFVVHPYVPPAHGGTSPEHELGMGIHGGHDETSLMLHLRPGLVDMDLAVRQVPEHLLENRHVRFGGSVQFGWMSDDFGPHGHIGDPTRASAADGARLFAAAVELVSDQLREIVRFEHSTGDTDRQGDYQREK